MAKKNRQDINKRRAKAIQKYKAKRKARLAVRRGQESVQIRYRPGITEMNPPDGFRSIGMAQAMMEYGKPLIKLTKGESDLNPAIQAAMLLWNHALNVEKGKESEDEKSKIIELLSETFGITKEDADSLRQQMVDRRSFLFPDDKQPNDRTMPFMFIRKETTVEIIPFPYDLLISKNDVLPADSEDDRLIEKIMEIDRFIIKEDDYSAYEKLLIEVKDQSEKRFRKWLADKGYNEKFYKLSECLAIYLDFVYGYMHDDVFTLKSIPEDYFEEFFEDYLLRKMYTEPQEYVDWPPAIKLFYQFLKEKGYLYDPSPMINAVDKIEHGFIDLLRKQFG